jgi:hypothetical protein
MIDHAGRDRIPGSARFDHAGSSLGGSRTAANTAGIGTWISVEPSLASADWLPRRLRACPSVGLDELRGEDYVVARSQDK